MDDVERLLTIEDVADRLQIPVATLRKWRLEGRGPQGFRVGRFVRFRPVDVDAWVLEQIPGRVASSS
jgi:excisionase family DNA binding protein